MTKEQDPQTSSSASRQGSLSHHRQTKQPEIPKYLKSVSGADEQAAVAELLPKTQDSRSSPEKPKGAIVLTMSKGAIFAIFLGATMLAVSSFVAGVLVTQRYLQPTSQQEDKPVEAKTAKKVEIPQTVNTTADDDLSALAISFADQFNKTSASEGFKEASEEIQTATEEVKITTELAEATPEAKALMDLETALKDREGPNTKVITQMFTITLGETTSEQEAQAMRAELEKAGLEDLFISTEVGPDGRSQYFVRSGKYETYSQAQRELTQLPSPYSMWGKVAEDKTITTTKG